MGARRRASRLRCERGGDRVPVTAALHRKEAGEEAGEIEEAQADLLERVRQHVRRPVKIRKRRTSECGQSPTAAGG